MTDRFESILDESISALQAGVSIDEILAEVPDYANELRPLLYAATLLADPNPKLVPEEKKNALRAEYVAQAATLAPVSPTLADKVEAIFRIIKRRITRRAVLNDLTTITITILLTLLMSALILTFAAADSLPGDLLYSVKRISENLQLSLTVEETSRQVLENRLNQERLAEVRQLIEQNRTAVVQFKGVLETKGETLWIVEGLTVLAPDEINVQGNPQEGDTVEVAGLLRTNQVVAADAIRKVE